MKKRGKKAQITIFIILGIVLLLSVGVAIYFYQQRATAPIKKVVTVPEDIQQIYDYVTTCIDQIGKDGIIILGAQGGYIDIPAVIDRNPNAHINEDPLGIAKTVMWYYEGEDRTPSLDYMQRALALYVKQNIPDCVGNFEAFAERFEVTPKSEILPVVSFTDSDVIIEVKWQLEIKTQDRVAELNEFVTDYSVKLRPAWELASKAMEAENKQGWFENLTIDLISSHPKIPVSGMEFSCGPKKWHIQQVKKEIQLMLYYNFPYIRVDNTNYPPPLESLRTYDNLKETAQDIRKDLEAQKEPDWPEDTPPDAFEMNRMRFDVGAKRTDLKAAFVYQPEWPLLVNAQPNSGGILSTAQMKGARKYLSFLCINQWHFAYDLIYPVKMLVKDDTAFNGEGFIFQMAFPVIIEDNEESRTFFGLRRFIVPDTGAEFCTTVGTQRVDVRAMGFEEGVLAAVEIEDANITYQCVNQECILGKTYSDGSGAIRLNTYLPEGCSNPALIASKPGYIPKRAYSKKDLVEILMTKLKKLPYTIMMHPYCEIVEEKNPTKAKDCPGTNQRWREAETYSKFTKTMHATVSISLRNESYDQFKSYPASAEAFTATQEKGAYQLAEIENVTTDEIEFVYGDAKYDIDIIVFKGSTPIGGYHAENMTIFYDEVARANNVILHVVEYRPLPEKDYQQAGMFVFLYERGKYLDDKPYSEALRPTFT